MKKILIVGGTGMLKELVLRLSENNKIFLLARDEEKLNEIKSYNPENITCLPLDYSDYITLEREISKYAPYDETIAWIHKYADRTPIILAQYTNKFYHILNHSYLDFRKRAELLRKLSLYTDYHQIVLGKKQSEDDWRWLTDDEICTGVESAIFRNKRVFVVGD